ncbi:hypothetical protein Tco_1184291 [Tanacetum coccineum]
MTMEILLDPTSNKLMVGDLCDSIRIKVVTTGKKRRFYTSAGNPVKEILLKLNLPDHRSILTNSKMVVKFTTIPSRPSYHFCILTNTFWNLKLQTPMPYFFNPSLHLNHGTLFYIIFILFTSIYHEIYQLLPQLILQKIKLNIIPPRQLFVNISSDEDITTTPSPTTTSSSLTPPNAPSKTTSTNQNHQVKKTLFFLSLKTSISPPSSPENHFAHHITPC